MNIFKVDEPIMVTSRMFGIQDMNQVISKSCTSSMPYKLE